MGAEVEGEYRKVGNDFEKYETVLKKAEIVKKVSGLGPGKYEFVKM